MTLLQVLRIIVAASTIVIGLLAFLRPKSIEGFVGLEAPGVRGVSEIRAIFGGLFVGLGAAPLILGAHDAYVMLGIVYAAIAIARAFSTVFDRSFASSNLGSLAAEVVFAVLLLL